MKEIHIYYSRIKLWWLLCLSCFGMYCLLAESHLPNILRSRLSTENSAENNFILFFFIVGIGILVWHIQFAIRNLFHRKPQISINAQYIYHHQTSENADWNQMTSFHFWTWRKFPYLELVRHSGYRTLSFSLSYLAYDKARLSDLFTQLIATNDINEREKWIAQFQAA